jgi:nitrate reductase gamma subunit
MHESELLQFAKHSLHTFALLFMAIVYAVRLIWLFRFMPMKERQARVGRLTTNSNKGSLYSLFNIFIPWAMESTRTNLFFYFQFGLFHIGIATALCLSFIIAYIPQLLTPMVIQFMQVFIVCAFIIGCIRILRRIFIPAMRAISSPDDYFSLTLITLWLALAFFAAPNNTAHGEFLLLSYLFITAFLIIYVPFSKISHYLYYPITRYYLGKTLGNRGVFPLERGKKKIA